MFWFTNTGSHVGMKAALQCLGYHDVYHMTNVVGHLDDCNDWIKALDAKYDKKGTFTREDWDKLLGRSQVSHKSH